MQKEIIKSRIIERNKNRQRDKTAETVQLMKGTGDHEHVFSVDLKALRVLADLEVCSPCLLVTLDRNPAPDDPRGPDGS